MVDTAQDEGYHAGGWIRVDNLYKYDVVDWEKRGFTEGVFYIRDCGDNMFFYKTKKNKWVRFTTKIAKTIIRDQDSYIIALYQITQNFPDDEYVQSVSVFIARFLYDRVLEKEYKNTKERMDILKLERIKKQMVKSKRGHERIKR
jgi:hypothetical protein